MNNDFAVTFFSSRFATKTDNIFSFKSFHQLFSFFEKSSSLSFTHKEDSPLYSPAIFNNNSSRKSSNVKSWQRVSVLDVDDHVGKNIEEEVRERFNDVCFLCHSTASSRENHPKFRVIIPLEESVLSTDIPHFWYALNKTFGSMGDEATKDSARMYYMPGTFPGAFSFIFKETSKKLLNPCLLYTSPSPRDRRKSRMPSSA